MNNLFIIGIALTLTQKSFAAINKDAVKLIEPKNVVVAVIDTGADLNHEELKDFIWTNEGETGIDINGNDKATNQIDDDGNGFVDDVHGWNFSNNTNDVSDHLGHGTHVSGIIKNEFSHFEEKLKSPRSLKLMIIKYYDPEVKGQDNLNHSIQAIEYANKMQAHIINYSGGGSEASYRERLAIQQSAKQDILFVAAAGNNYANTDFEKYYPANYPLENIISVAATNDYGELVPFSNYGSNIAIAAPGKLIYSCLPKNKYGYMSGTSQATAFVTGQAARLLVGQEMSPQSLLIKLKNSGTYKENLKGKTRTQVALMIPNQRPH